MCRSLGYVFADTGATMVRRVVLIVVISPRTRTRTAGDKMEGPLPPPTITPLHAEVGGWSTDWTVWVEDIADDIGATSMDYAVRRVVLSCNPSDIMFILACVPILRMHGP